MSAEEDCKKKCTGYDNKYDYDKKYGVGIRHLQMGCMFTCLLTLFIGRSCISVAILAMTDPNRAERHTVYNWDKYTQGLIISSFFWGYTVMQVPSGMLAKRFGGKTMLLIALLANAVLSAIFPILAHLGGWQLLCAARVTMGLTQSCLFPTIHMLLGKWLPAHERTALSGVVYGGVQLGTIISMPISGVLAETSMGWKLIFYVIGALMFATGVLWYFFAASTPRSHRLMSVEERQYIEKGLHISEEGNLRIPWIQIFSTKALWALMVAQSAGGIGFMLFFSEVPTYLERCLHLSLRNSSVFSSLPFASMWLTTVLSTLASEIICNKGLLSIESSRKIFTTLTLLGTATGFVALSFLDSEHPTYIIIILITTLMMGGFNVSGYMINIIDLSPNYAGVLFSITNTVSNFVCILVPITTSWILQNDATVASRWQVLFLTTAGVYVVSNVIYLMYTTSECQQWDDPYYLDTVNTHLEETKPVIDETQESNKHQSRRTWLKT